MSYFFAISLAGMAIFLIMLVLVQRGRGGGLAGALGGVGGSSAFGAKAGDVFTKITVVTAFLWIVLCVCAAYWAGHRTGLLADMPTPAASSSAGATDSAADGESATAEQSDSDTGTSAADQTEAPATDE